VLKFVSNRHSHRLSSRVVHVWTSANTSFFLATDIPTSTGSSKPSGTGASNGTSSGVAQPTGTGAATGTGLATGGGPVSTGTPTQSGGVTESTGAAGRLELSFVGMVAGLGVMAAAL
jgi:hypothetical protein